MLAIPSASWKLEGLGCGAWGIVLPAYDPTHQQKGRSQWLTVLTGSEPPRHSHCFLNRQYDEYISNVDIRTEYIDNKSNHQRVVYKFRPYVFEGIDSIEIKGTSLMPQRVVDKIVQECLPNHPYRVDIGLMDLVREKIEKW